MKIWLDTEFIDNGKTIEPLSVGMVREDGAEYYAVCSDTDQSKACDWVKVNVLPHLGGPEKTKRDIKFDLLEFSGAHPEFYGYFADYDWVVICQMFGRMTDLPSHWPMFCRDIQQTRVEQNQIALPEHAGTAHNALDDARWTRQCWEFLAT